MIKKKPRVNKRATIYLSYTQKPNKVTITDADSIMYDKGCMKCAQCRYYFKENAYGNCIIHTRTSPDAKPCEDFR